MTSTSTPDAKFVRGPLGAPLSLADLPPADTQRWVIRRKAEVIAAVQGGLLTCEEACDRHGLAGLKIYRFDYFRRRQAYGLA
jgi:hypothetical protein